MSEVEYPQLQRQYGGRYVARRREEVIASAATYDELSDQLDGMGVDWSAIIIEYIEPITSIHVAVDFTIRCLFVDSPTVPFLLGRADFLDRFVLTFDQPQRRVTLTELF